MESSWVTIETKTLRNMFNRYLADSKREPERAIFNPAFLEAQALELKTFWTNVDQSIRRLRLRIEDYQNRLTVDSCHMTDDLQEVYANRIQELEQRAEELKLACAETLNKLMLLTRFMVKLASGDHTLLDDEEIFLGSNGKLSVSCQVASGLYTGGRGMLVED